MDLSSSKVGQKRKAWLIRLLQDAFSPKKILSLLEEGPVCKLESGKILKGSQFLSQAGVLESDSITYP